jgi:cytosine deaminase
MNLTDYGIRVGNPADVVVLDSDRRSSALSELAQPLFGYKRGKRTFTRAHPILHKPGCGCGAD